ncbi:methylated-DNA--[protein]-cysteine S-methyltransferase [Paraferrimonas sedimenticola]|uniref:methylated-DNA--[protein]-cysteine S-methyltransferase n=1 Tax=Paraferrimonas sedimenticola TaxID=375674 RepID=A0AA37RUT2_9GAMM|nr:methylated-DNA--[protein]-cysteine S-methyltransferase [Paraferrimonas sedimenticola]GLP95945.1 methylated-DNA--protein-cysteine methyltransferase [Paraferrimonas sedimenticola]
MDEVSRAYQQIGQAIEYLQANFQDQPELGQVASAVGMSESNLQRQFSRWAGVSPKRFLQYLTKEHALAALKHSDSVLEASLSAGLSSPGRLHDLMVTCEALTPGEIKRRGEGLNLGYGVAATPFGEALFGWSERGLCYLAFVDNEQQPLDRLKTSWPLANWQAGDAQPWAQRVFANSGNEPLHLLLKGSNFQIKVWQALLNVAQGELVSYAQLASMANSPKASRAVGSAMAANEIAYLIPCHRVILGSGEVGHYRWGSERKRIMQAWEAAQRARA